MTQRPKRPRDANQLAKAVVDIATGSISDPPQKQTNEGARRGGLKGGRIRAEKLSPERREEIAKKAALARWAAKSD